METYLVSGMSCAACSARVEKAVSAVPGVTSCAVSLLTNSMAVEGTAPEKAIVAAVEKAGYGARPEKAAKSETAADPLADRETPLLKKRLFASLGFLAVLMYLSMGHAMWGWPLPSFFEENPVAAGMAQMLLAAAVMIVNQKFFVSGFRSLLHRAPNMDALVATGSFAAFAYSAAVLFRMTSLSRDEAMKELHGLYFETAAMILAFITVGKMLEARAKGKTTSALRALMELAPETASVERDGREITVKLGEVRVGDVFLVRPGEKIPVDGAVLEGESAVNEAALTGESLPADKAAGDAVSAGTMNQSGFLRCRAERVGEDTALAGIIRTVRDAAATKAPIAKAADRVAGVFVPVVMSIALVTAAVWLILGESVGFALARGVSVLVISCPCALGLATPVAIMVGSGIGARNGILFKNAGTLEETGKTDVVLLDKTGTVTEGEPRVAEIFSLNGDEKALLADAAALEKKSEHPLAKAILSRAGEEGIGIREVTDFAAVPGNGLTASLGGETLFGGSAEFASRFAPVPDEVKKIADAWRGEGKTALFFGKNGALTGAVAVADPVKEDSRAAISELRGMGMRVVMLTGDHPGTANAVAREAGVDEVRAGMLPDGKAEAVREWKKEGRVMMVGDGINDAPALTEADTGVAIGAGTDVAIDAAGVVLMKSRLSDVSAAVRLSRRVLTAIHQNLFWALCYNVVGIPLAAGVFIRPLGWEMDPMFGAAAMSLSSFLVVANALRLNFADIRSPRRDRKRKKKNKMKETEIMEKTLNVKGMMCMHCEARVKKALEALPGVAAAEASHETGEVKITLSAPVADEVLKKTVEDQGYEVV